MIPLIPKTKMVDIGKLISLRKLLVRKITWFVLATTYAPLILSCAFGADHKTRITYIYSLLLRTHSLTFWLPETAWPCHWVIQFNMHNMGAYTFCNHFFFLFYLYSLTCSSLEHSLRNFVKPRKGQTTNIGEDTFLLEYIAIFLYIGTSYEILSHHTFYSLQDTFNF